MSGLLGKAALVANTNTTIYTVPADAVVTANINLCNRTAAAITVRLSIGAAIPADSDFIEYDTSIPAYGVLERSGMAMAAAENLVARASATGVSIRAFGFTEVA
ncbi:MAG: hypothetical protein FIA89_09115 [Geobacter sp.]|nr:hypothetical protein [Geobacter sp.]